MTIATLIPMLAETAAASAGAPGAWMLPMMVALPLVFAIGVVLMPGRDDMARTVALGVSAVVFMLSLITAMTFDFTDGATLQLTSNMSWMPSLGISLSFGIDSISMWLILLTTFLMPITILGTWNDGGKRPREFYLWLLALEGALIGVFAATDLILFYVFFELTLVPLFFLIGIFGSTNKLYAAYKFFVFTLAGSVFTFAGVVYVAYHVADQTGVWTFYLPALMEALANTEIAMSATQQGWVMLALMIGFAVKVPLWPVHTWLPLAHTEAPTAGSVILAGVLLKLGSYGMLRFVLPMVPEAVVEYAGVVAVLCIIGIIYAALICWVQSDIKKLVAYSSVSHMGFCILGLFAVNHAGVGGSVMYMINHGIATGALFLCVGMIYNRYHTRQMDELGGLGKVMPVWSFFMVFFCLASVGLPGLNGFVGEFLTIFGAFTSDFLLGPWYAAFAAIGLILGAIYILYMLGRVVLGPLKLPVSHDDDHGPSDLNGREIATLAPLAVACLVLGLYPTPVLRSLESNITAITKPVVVQIEAAKAEQAEQGDEPKISLTLDPEVTP